MGLPGAGKSTLARALQRRLGAARVDRDALRARRFPGEPVTAAHKRVASAEVWREAAALLRARRSVIVDGMTFAGGADRRHAAALARRLRARCRAIYLDCPPELARRRVARALRHPASDRTPALVTEVAARFEPVGREALRLDATKPAGALARAALTWLASVRRPGCPARRAR